MTKNEETTVQVPVSLIERAKQFDHRGGLGSEVHAWLSELLTLLSQPTPSAEAEAHQTLRSTLSMVDLRIRSDLPRIEDMAPGTTFTAEMRGGPGGPHEWVVTPYGSVAVRLWTPGFNDRIDPSTIRDVQPPKEPTA